MRYLENYIERAREELPDPCTVKDLIKLGIYRSEQAAYHSRVNHMGPEFFQFDNSRVIYPKDAVIAYMKKCMLYSHPIKKGKPKAYKINLDAQKQA